MFLPALFVPACTPRACLVTESPRFTPQFDCGARSPRPLLRLIKDCWQVTPAPSGQFPVGFPVHTWKETMCVRYEEEVPALFEEHDLNLWNDVLNLVKGCHTEPYDCYEEEVPEPSGAAGWGSRKDSVLPRKATTGVVATAGARDTVGRTTKLAKRSTSRRHDAHRVLEARQVLTNAAGPPSSVGCARQSTRLPWMSVTQS